MVEHDEEIIRAADYIIDIGPNAGRLGGEVVYQGDMKDLSKGSNSHDSTLSVGRGRNSRTSAQTPLEQLYRTDRSPGKQPQRSRCTDPPQRNDRSNRRFRIGQKVPWYAISSIGH